MFSKEVKTAENIWEKNILRFLDDLYEGRWIPSHDIFHHQRVWRNAVKILPFFEDEIRENQTVEFIQELLIACYFHDTGLLIDPGFQHGKESRKICARFLNQHKENVFFSKDQLLDAIEKHDEKNYSESDSSEFQLLHKILTLADDIDAFGAVGAYRYAEIYLCREIPAKQIPEKVLSNSAERYQNLMRFIPGKFPEIETAYSLLVKIFTAGVFEDSPIELLELIHEELIIPQLEPYICFEVHAEKAGKGSRREYFLKHFMREWESEIGE